jgi:dihydrolipoamide dehydrogenase
VAVEDPIVSQVLSEVFDRRGIEVITGIGGVERIDKTEQGLKLWYKVQDGLQAVEAEAVVLSVGWVGNIEELNLPAAGVQTERSYIVVDDHLRTTTPHIFAAGDITGRMMLVQSGSYEGRVAAENAILARNGGGMPYRHIIVPHGGFTDPEYGSVGLTEEKARAQHDVAVAVVPFRDVDRAVIDGYPDGYCKLIVSKETHRILGAHVVGEQAVEIIQLVAAGMASDMWVEQLAELELAYPTYTAIVGLAARKIIRDLGVVPLAPQWRALGNTHLAEWERSST